MESDPTFPTEDVRIRRSVQATLDGDPNAFEPIVERYQRLVWHIVSRYLLPDDLAEDLAQQCFLEAYRVLDRWDPQRSFANWLAGIARNQCRMALRDRHTAARHLSAYREHLERQPDSPEPTDPRLHALRRCLEGVEGDAALLLELRYQEGWDFGAIATRLGRSAEATRRLASRVRAALRRCTEGLVTT